MTSVPALTDEEIERLAIDVVTNVVYLPLDPEAIKMSFGMMIALSNQQLPDNVGLVYEEWNKANERGVNGYPTFFSMKLVAKESVEPLINRIWDKARALGLTSEEGR